MDNMTLTGLCKQAIQQLRNNFGWTLLEESDFITMIYNEIDSKENTTLAKVQITAKGIYSETLYTSCQDPEQREQAYTELHHYLYTIAHYKQHNIAEDATQKAIELIHEKIKQCHTPRAFLKFAQYKLLDAMKYIRKMQRVDQEIPLEILEEKYSQEKYTKTESECPEDEVIHQELVEKVKECIQRIFLQLTRARRQLQAVLLKYIDKLSDDEIAQNLGTTPESVRVLRTRGLAKLRDCLERENMTL